MQKFLSACAVLTLALASACGNTHRLIVQTERPGAQISIVKRGEIHTQVGPGTLSEPFEDPDMTLGSSPLTYDLPVVEAMSDANFFGASLRREKICKEVVVRVWEGGHYSESVIPVSGGGTAFLSLKNPEVNRVTLAPLGQGR